MQLPSKSNKETIKKIACAGAIGVGILSGSVNANAETFNESNIATGDFADVFELANVLPNATTEVIGTSRFLDDDFFSLNFAPFSEAIYSVAFDDTDDDFQFFDSSANPLLLEATPTFSNTFTGSFIIPADGIVVTRLYDDNNYRVSIDVASVPEPASSSLLLLGAACLLSTRRRWK